MNQLLETQAKAMDKARSRASDLAHGLKTPLSVISNNALRLEEKGETEIATELNMLSEAMLAHVNLPFHYCLDFAPEIAQTRRSFPLQAAA